jgi:hypothetical protein
MVTSDLVSGEVHYLPRAAIDVSTGYGAEAFLQNRDAGDPWAEVCFVSLIEAFTNHAQLRYPFPSHHSVRDRDYQGIADFMGDLQSAGLLQGDDAIIAEDIPLGQLDLETDFLSFSRWARTHRVVVKQWVEFHHQPELKKRHKTQLPTIVNVAVQEFFDRNPSRFNSLASAVRTTPKRILYSFDVASRGRQYAALLGGSSNYYSHPIREPVLNAAETRRTTIRHAFSWGRYLAWALRSGRLHRTTPDVIEVMGSLKRSIARLKADARHLSTMEPSVRKGLLNQVAAEAGLPATLRADVHEYIEHFFSYTHIAVALLDAPSIHLSVAIGNFVANNVSMVPGWLPRILPFFRGLVEYPFLAQDGQVDER